MIFVRQLRRLPIHGFLLCAITLRADRVLIDAIDTVIHPAYEGNAAIITVSDLARSDLTGGVPTRDEKIFRKLTCQDAYRHKWPDDDEAVEKYIARIMAENHMTREQVETMFLQTGRSYEEGLQELKELQTNKMWLETMIGSKLIVPRAKVEEYWAMHPELHDTAYEIQVAFIPGKKEELKKTQATVARQLKTMRDSLKLDWQAPLFINEKDLSETMKFIPSMRVGTTAVTVVDAGVMVVRLLSTKERSLEDAYAEIAMFLRRPLFESLMDEYKEELLKDAAVVRFDNEIVP